MGFFLKILRVLIQYTFLNKKQMIVLIANINIKNVNYSLEGHMHMSL